MKGNYKVLSLLNVVDQHMYISAVIAKQNKDALWTKTVSSSIKSVGHTSVCRLLMFTSGFLYQVSEGMSLRVCWCIQVIQHDLPTQTS